jgi:hypothetical protein
MPLTENDWNALLFKIRSGRCTPFIGAGASHPVLPLASELAERLVADHERESGTTCPLPDRRDLARVTEYLAIAYRDNTMPKLKIAELIRTMGRPDFSNELEPHRILADLDLPLYLTTNYDGFLLDALKLRRPGARREYARWTRFLLENRSSDFDTGYEPSRDQPAVFHLHGHADVPEAMVATEDDYLDFLVNISKDLANSPTDRRKKAVLPLAIRSAIMTTTLLFIGYGLADINFRVILRGLLGSLEPSGQQINIAVQWAGDSSRDLQAYLEQYFDRTLGLSIFWGSSQDFATKLRQLLSK